MIHARTVLEQDLARLQDDVVQMGGMVDDAVRLSMEALTHRDFKLAQQIVSDDQKVNDCRYVIEEACLRVIATQQPVAGDLRLIIGAMHMAGEMERMADHAEGIARVVIRTAQELSLTLPAHLPGMAVVAREMLKDVLHAYLARDAVAAKAVASRDHELDRLHAQVLRETLDWMIEDRQVIDRLTQLLWVSHNLERIGDRVTNLAERMIFMYTGRLEELDGSWSPYEPSL